MTTTQAPKCTAVGLSQPKTGSTFDPRRQVGPEYFTGSEWDATAVDVVARSGVFAYERLGEALDFMSREPSFTLAGSNLNIAMAFIDDARATIQNTIFEMIGDQELATIYREQ
jgi:hypothetical protein